MPSSGATTVALALCGGLRGTGTLSPESDFRGVVGDDIVFREKLVDSIPPKSEQGLEAHDAVV